MEVSRHALMVSILKEIRIFKKIKVRWIWELSHFEKAFKVFKLGPSQRTLETSRYEGTSTFCFLWRYLTALWKEFINHKISVSNLICWKEMYADLLKLRFNFQNVFEMGAGAVKVYWLVKYRPHQTRKQPQPKPLVCFGVSSSLLQQTQSWP